jgi:hypothetical protein
MPHMAYLLYLSTISYHHIGLNAGNLEAISILFMYLVNILLKSFSSHADIHNKRFICIHVIVCKIIDSYMIGSVKSLLQINHTYSKNDFWWIICFEIPQIVYESRVQDSTYEKLTRTAQNTASTVIERNIRR